jgi:hypothetical protein
MSAPGLFIVLLPRFVTQILKSKSEDREKVIEMNQAVPLPYLPEMAIVDDRGRDFSLNQMRRRGDQDQRAWRGRWGITMRFRFVGAGLLLGTVLMAGSASAYDAYDQNNCNGVDWNDKQALVVSKVIAKPHVIFIKSPYDDDFKASSCPADTEACRKKSYLVTGDLVLTGKTRGAFTCVVYQSPRAKKQIWTIGWLLSSALQPVAPMPSPKTSDWLGTWSHPGGDIEIKQVADGKLSIEGEMVVPTAQDAHTGEIAAKVMPGKDTIAFVDDGSTPFEKDGGECRVRMQRIGTWLMVEDNEGCGGAAVTFTGLYRRE